MKKFLLPLLLFISLLAQSQAYNNEWINYSRTYYKFKVGATGLYRISQPTLASIGIGSTPAEQFQLWRNGHKCRFILLYKQGQWVAVIILNFGAK